MQRAGNIARCGCFTDQHKVPGLHI